MKNLNDDEQAIFDDLSALLAGARQRVAKNILDTLDGIEAWEARPENEGMFSIMNDDVFSELRAACNEVLDGSRL